MKNIVKISLLLIAFSFTATSCNKDKDGWSLYFGFTSSALLGEYFPNQELWENELPEDHFDSYGTLIQYVPMVDAGCIVHRYTTTNLDNLQFEFSGFPSDIASVIGNNFTCDVYYSNNSYSFSLNNDSEVTVYKDKYGNVRLHGWIRKLTPNQPYGYDVIDIYKYYCFDIVK